MPKVSILIPVFNREHFISECIRSALDQTFTDLEVVVVDNASNDGTWDICQEFASLDSRVRIFRNEKNIGPVRNWLRCIEEARGEYGKFLFSDDLILANFLSKTLPHLADPGIAFASTAALIGTEIKHSKVHYGSDTTSEIISTDAYLERLAHGVPAVPVSPGAALFRMIDIRKNLILNIPIGLEHDFARNGAGPDVLLFALTAKNYKSVAMLREPLVFFRAHAGSFTIADEGSSVTEGYRLALGWFFKNFSTPRNWAYWTAKIWLKQSKNSMKLKNPFRIASRYSGKGSLQEVAQMTSAATRLLIMRLISA